MTTKSETTFTRALDARLEEMFGEGENQPKDDDTFLTTTQLIKSPLKNLKSIILTLDWEISDEIMDHLNRELAELKDMFPDDHVILSFIRILGALGRHIRKKGGRAHQDSFKLLNSGYYALEEIVLDRRLGGDYKKTLLYREVEKFKKLKSELVAETEGAKKGSSEIMIETRQELCDEGAKDKEHVQAPGEIKTRDIKHDEATVSESETLLAIKELTPHEAFAYALDEIKKTIQAEFSALRAELKMWRQGQ